MLIFVIIVQAKLHRCKSPHRFQKLQLPFASAFNPFDFLSGQPQVLCVYKKTSGFAASTMETFTSPKSGTVSTSTAFPVGSRPLS